MTPDNRPEAGQGIGQGPDRAREFKTILHETLPCWHELSWENEGPILVLRVHESYADTLRINPDAPIVLGFQKTLDLGDFEGDLRGDFGFNEALKNQGEKDGFYEFAIELPTIKVTTDRACDRCDGTGRDADYDESCILCEGGGKKFRYDWRRADEISTSLSILTLRLPYYDHDVPTAFPQLMTFETSAGHRNSSLHGEIGIPFQRWLASFPDNTWFPGAVAAMETAYKKMFGPHVGMVAQHSFEMRPQNGGLITSCPGEGCGINPAGWNFREGKGYEFSSHNVDTPAQQLTLLAGLAALHDIARREISR